MISTSPDSKAIRNTPLAMIWRQQYDEFQLPRIAKPSGTVVAPVRQAAPGTTFQLPRIAKPSGTLLASESSHVFPNFNFPG